ncbi:transforming growth factor beta regulator 1 [Lutzomyia longipalpis]|uniref:transforming growth factor beta regulator 1 n=1 Tax=Lutzomyia longipalpis TaxID=7200 RepID=UPI0024833AFE|nr:transforming growth factor beta regulator 1 [Lutzomyia longipalpis]
MSYEYMDFSQKTDENEVYRRKLRKIKRRIKEMVYENAALCDQVAQLQDNITVVKEERRFLLKKLMEFEPPDPEMFRNANQEYMKKQGKKKDGSAPVKVKGTGKPGRPSLKSKQLAQQQAAKSQQPQMVEITIDANGYPTQYPFSVGHLTIASLGEIIFDRQGFHTEQWIYPVGYTAMRIYGSIRDPRKKTIYTCKILDGGTAPIFEITIEADPDIIISGTSPDSCHATLLQYLNGAIDLRNMAMRPQGDWFFGLAHPTIMTLIQNFPNAKKCIRFRGFEMVGGATYALDKDNDPALNFEALQRYIAISAYHTVPEIKEEPPDELFEQDAIDNYFKK